MTPSADPNIKHKKTIVLGASPSPHRYAYAAIQRLVAAGHEVIPIGIRKGSISGIPIQFDHPSIKEVDTVTIYLNKAHQAEYYDYILQEIRPRRLIFNPGAENPELIGLAREKGIEVLASCTLVMISAGTY